MVVSRLKLFPFCQAHEHKSHVVKPSGVADSSKKIGLGGGGTKFPENRPPSLPSKGNDKTASSSVTPAHQLLPLKLLPPGITTDTCKLKREKM